LPSIDATPESSATLCGARECDQREIITSQASIDAGHPSTGRDAFHPRPTSAASLIFAPTDLKLFGRLPEAARDNLSRTFRALEWIHSRPNKNEAFRVMALKCMKARGFTAASLRRKYYAFVASGDWTTLVDKALAGPEWWKTDESSAPGLPPAFIEFWKSLCERNQRKCRPAHGELLKIWRQRIDSLGNTYKQIPGYAEWPVASPTTDRPRGWEYSNLMRHAPDDFELDAARHGRFAASKHRRKVFLTREGLQVMQFCFFDDQVYDAKVLFTSTYGQPSRPMRPRGYDALDLASAAFVGHLFKPTLLNPDAPEHELHLSSKREFPWFLADVLLNVGYNPITKTFFVVERGTASIDQALEERLFNVSGGMVMVDRAGLINRATHAALFDGASKGNPRFKAPLESIFNLVRNNMAMLPGQVGKDRDHSPDDLHGRERYDARLVRCLTPELLQHAIRPFMEWTDFVEFALAVYTAIDNRIDHDLEGWRKNKALEWRISPSAPWMPMSEFERLPVPQQMSLTELFRGPHGSTLNRSRKLSPREVFNTGAKALHRLSFDSVPYLLGAELGTERTVRDGYITLEDQQQGPAPLRFPAYSHAASGSRGACLRNGDKFLTYLLRDGLVLADASNRFVGVLTQQDTPCRADVEGVKRQLAAAKKEESARLAPLDRRHITEAREKNRMHRHNSDLAETASGTRKPRTTEERATDRAIDSALEENFSFGGANAAAEPTPAASAASDIDPTQDFE
jgi:hypothetical protein